MASSYRGPPNIRRIAPPNYGVNSSPANNYYQPGPSQTTMFLPAQSNQVPFSLTAPQGSNFIVRPPMQAYQHASGVPIGMSQPMPNLGNTAQHYTITTSQPPQFSITQQNPFSVQMGYPMPPQAMPQSNHHQQMQQPPPSQQAPPQQMPHPPPQASSQYYGGMQPPQVLPRPSVSHGQQQSTSFAPQPISIAPAQSVTASFRPQSQPSAHTAAQQPAVAPVGPPQPRKRQGIPIIDPTTGLDVMSSSAASQEGPVQTQGAMQTQLHADANAFVPGSSFTQNAVHASGVMAQPFPPSQMLQQGSSSHDASHSTDTGPVTGPVPSFQNRAEMKPKLESKISAQFSAQVAAVAFGPSEQSPISTSNTSLASSTTPVIPTSSHQEMQVAEQQTVTEVVKTENKVEVVSATYEPSPVSQLEPAVEEQQAEQAAEEPAEQAPEETNMEIEIIKPEDHKDPGLENGETQYLQSSTDLDQPMAPVTEVPEEVPSEEVQESNDQIMVENVASNVECVEATRPEDVLTSDELAPTTEDLQNAAAETPTEAEEAAVVEEPKTEEEPDKSKNIRQRPPGPEAANAEEVPKDEVSSRPMNGSEDGFDATPSRLPTYEYKEDKHEPIAINKEKKLQYDRDFLMKFQFVKQKPKDLPDLEIVLASPSFSKPPQHPPQMRGVGGGGYDFTPGFAARSLQGPVGRSGGQTRGPHRSHGGSQSKNQKVISIPKAPEVKLHTTDNPYKIEKKKDKSQVLEDPIQAMHRQMRSVLNKLTPQKFDTLVDEAVKLTKVITNKEELEGLIRLIFEKAVDEPAFSVAYANFCRVLCQAAQLGVDAPQEVKSKMFKVALLNSCQREFEANKQVALKEIVDRHDALIEAASESNKKEAMENKEEALIRHRQRIFGNIRFIGELFCLQMLTGRIMHQCVQILLGIENQKDKMGPLPADKVDPDNIECLCRLLFVIGGILDGTEAAKAAINSNVNFDAAKKKSELVKVDDAKLKMDIYLKRAKEVADVHNISRLKFMIMDVCDLRENKWVQKDKDNKPKTIQQIHKEAAEEKEKNLQALQRLSMEKPRTPRSQRPGPSVDEHGFTTVRPSNKIDHSKLRLPKLGDDADNIQLGPQRQVWGKGATGGGRSASQEKDRSSGISGGNRFSALSDVTSRAGPGLRLDRQMGKQAKVIQRTSQERERSEALLAARKINQPPIEQRGPSPVNNSVAAPVMPPPTAPPPGFKKPPVVKLSEEDVERKMKSLLEEYFTNKDLKDARHYASEMQGHFPLFVEKAVSYVLERSAHSRDATSHVFVELMKTNIMPVKDFVEGMSPVIENAEFDELDIPLIWQYLGEIFGWIVGEPSVPLTILKDVLKKDDQGNPQPPNTEGFAKMVSKTLHQAAHRLGHNPVTEAWRDSKLSWKDFLPEGVTLDEFIKKEKLEFLAEKAHDPQDILPLDAVEQELLKILKDGLNEDAFDYVANHVPAKEVSTPAFARCVTSAVCDSVISNSHGAYEVNEELLKQRCLILQRYLDHKPDFELHALYAIQAVVHKIQHPQGVLRSFFDILYDEDIISEESFNAWNSSEDPAEQAGKGIAVASVAQFFTWLHTAEPEESND